MSIEIKVPSVGESITEVVIGEWYVADGGYVAKDADVVGLESDKATFDVPAPVGGIVHIDVSAGQEAQIGDVIGHIEESEPPEGHDGGQTSESTSAKSSPAPAAAASGTNDGGGTATHVMPAAQRLLDEHGLDATAVAATGPGGRLLKEDVLRHVEGGAAGGNGAMVPAARSEEVVPMSPIRRRIAERLVEAQTNAALLTTFNDVDMTAVMNLRKTYKEAFVEEHEVKLGFMSFFVKAAVDALKRYPAINAEIRGREIAYKNFFDVGVAIGGGKGLVVPVIRNAERLSFAEIEETINDFGARARKNDIGLDELQGGTFTISNGGVYGSLLSTPIVNPPQSGVLGMHRIEQRPVVVDGQVVPRPMMYLALTYDHRIVDGREAVQFLARIKECIEDPTRMILEV